MQMPRENDESSIGSQQKRYQIMTHTCCILRSAKPGNLEGEPQEHAGGIHSMIQAER